MSLHKPKSKIASCTRSVKIKKKKILIFTSKGGYCSWAASDSLAQFLSPDYQVTIVNPFEQIFSSLDYVKKLTRGKSDGEDAYNHLLNTKLIGLVNFLCRYVAPHIISWNFKKMEERLRWFLYQDRPDLIISVAPWINQPISRAAAAYNIPFVISTLDTDLFMWLFGMEYDDCAYSLITTHEYLASQGKMLEKAGFAQDAIRSIGIPLRKSFFEPKDQNAIRSFFTIPKDKFTIMLLMGGTGAKSMEHYVKKIVTLNEPVHLLICVGRDSLLKQRIESLMQHELKSRVTCSVIGFTDKISDLMSVSHLLITKTGPGSINEAVRMGLPMLLDCTSKVLFWEHPNIGFVKELGFGQSITSFEDVAGMIESYLLDTSLYEQTRDRLNRYQKPQFHHDFKKIVVDLMDQR